MTTVDNQVPVLLVEDDGRTRWITLNRPEHGNSFTTDMLLELKAELDRAQ